MLLEIHPDDPQEERIKEAVDCLKGGGVIIYPTDTIYAIGCDVTDLRALEKVAKIKGIKLSKANFSLVCYDLSHLSKYAKAFSTHTFKTMKRALPGPYTFILPASPEVPRLFKNKKKTVGIRVPDCAIAREIVLRLGNPIVATSVHDDDEVLEYTTDPSLIHDRYDHHVDLVIDGGMGSNIPSTVVDCTGDGIEVIREGAGDIDVI